MLVKSKEDRRLVFIWIHIDSRYLQGSFWVILVSNLIFFCWINCIHINREVLSCSFTSNLVEEFGVISQDNAWSLFKYIIRFKQKGESFSARRGFRCPKRGIFTDWSLHEPLLWGFLELLIFFVTLYFVPVAWLLWQTCFVSTPDS